MPAPVWAEGCAVCLASWWRWLLRVLQRVDVMMNVMKSRSAGTLVSKRLHLSDIFSPEGTSRLDLNRLKPSYFWVRIKV